MDGKKLESPRSERKDINVLDPDHPLLEKFQQSLKEHLLREIDSIKADIYDFESGVKKNNIIKDELGVEVYEIQQVVCKQQQELDNVISKLQNVAAAREELENELQEHRAKCSEQKQKLFQAEKTDLELHNEINTIALLKQQITEWEEKVESDILLKKRISEQTKKCYTQLAEEKKAQDYLIYKVTAENWKLESEIETMNLQIMIKEQELEELNQTVAQGNTNIEALQAEYRCLMHSWNSVVVAICNRDKIMNCFKEEEKKEDEELKTIVAEIDQVKKLTKKEFNENEKLTNYKTRIELQIGSCKTKLEEELSKKELLEKNVYENQIILEQIQRDIQSAKEEIHGLEGYFSSIQQQHDKLANEKVALETNIMKFFETQVTNDHVCVHLSRLLHKQRTKNNIMETSVAEAENKYKVRISECDNLKLTNMESKRTLDHLEGQFNELLKEETELQLVIRENTQKIRSKEKHLEVLHLKLEKLIAKGLPTVSPLQVKINVLERHLEELQDKIKKLQCYWLREQRSLLTMSKERQDIIYNSNLLRKQIMIVSQKNIRINMEIEQWQKKEQKIVQNINCLMNRLNILCEVIFKKKGLKTDLNTKNSYMQYLAKNKLKDLELECLQIETEIAEFEEDKYNLSHELLGLSKEHLEWEKKLTLLKNTKDHIKEERSTGGEVHNMKREIHRMSVRHSQLRKAQEKLINDLEMCINRRDAIYRVADSRGKRMKGVEERFKHNFTRKIDDIKNKIKHAEDEITATTRKIEVVQREKSEVLEETRCAKLTEEEFTKELVDIQEGIEKMKSSRQLKFELLVMNQKKYNMYNDLSKGRNPFRVYKTEGQLTTEYTKQKDINNRLSMILENLMSDFPNYSHELNRVYNTLKLPTVVT